MSVKTGQAPGVMTGFTLIEVLVAFTILAVSIGALLVAFSGGIRNTALTQDYTQAVIIANSRLAESGLIHSLSPESIFEGVEGKFQWQKIINLADMQPIDSWQLYHVTIMVSWKTLNGQRSFELKSLRWGEVDE